MCRSAAPGLGQLCAERNIVLSTVRLLLRVWRGNEQRLQRACIGFADLRVISIEQDRWTADGGAATLSRSVPRMAPIASVATVHEAEERLRADRANANEIIDLLDLSETGAPRVRLAAVQSCRAVFTEWAASGTLVLSLAADDPTGTGASEERFPSAVLSGLESISLCYLSRWPLSAERF